ncbi:MAG: DUF3445 domain-containing protein [Salaquimonas sp.]|jgi:hypothetical protein|nr:DUF3445 domain-containing protein [Salaquimonas sp.]
MTDLTASASFTHTPWDGSHPNFRIGLEPLGERSWIEVDGQFDTYLGEKQKLLASRHDDVFRAEPGSLAVQEEALEMVLAELDRTHRDTHRRDGNVVTADGVRVDLDDPEMPPLEKAARLVQEDLVIMMPDDNGWRLAAGCVCFPSSWVLAEKFGKPIEQVHGPVPQFGPGTKNAAMINRIFDKLRTEIPVIRFNWSIYPDDALFHGAGRIGQTNDTIDQPFLRVEIQTLHKMARTGAMLFTIRIHVDPLTVLENHSDRQRLARGLAESLAGLDEAQCRYKGLTKARGQIIARLEAIAATRG